MVAVLMMIITTFNAPFVRRFRHIMERDVDLEAISDSVAVDLETMEETLESGVNVNIGDPDPFVNLQSMLPHAFIYGDDDVVSRQMMQKMHYVTVLMLKIHDKTREAGVAFKSQALANPSQRNYHINLPFNYLKLLVANPLRCRRISALPDTTPNQLVSLQQGQKWYSKSINTGPSTCLSKFNCLSTYTICHSFSDLSSPIQRQPMTIFTLDEHDSPQKRKSEVRRASQVFGLIEDIKHGQKERLERLALERCMGVRCDSSNHTKITKAL
ncbi:hypothetical protein BC941DRAFT_517418 [Chlamydoabsidia padenii]|nr:hypothetical protein BC941DRAFT_517418 [Chlamydoabsidia padenii]